MVLIESDWNLKTHLQHWKKVLLSINRIRLEFKGNSAAVDDGVQQNVLIESDWNLKVKSKVSGTLKSGINRIRLEFKDDGESSY